MPKSIATVIGEVEAERLHLFADESILACCAVAVIIVDHEGGIAKGLLTSKSRISERNTSIARLELVSGLMVANMVKNLCIALQRWPIKSVTIRLDSMVAMYWITNPGRGWQGMESVCG